MSIVTSGATGAEIEAVVHAILPTIIDFPEHHVLMALLGMILWIQAPDITPDELAKGTREVSEHICLWISANTTSAIEEGSSIVH